MDYGLISFDKCETTFRSEDPVYVTTFLRDLRRHIDATGRHTILYAGYLRALQLYGNENAFELTPKEKLNFENCRDLEICRAAARNDGYNPSDGRTSPWAGVYFSREYVMTYPGPLGTSLATAGEASSSTSGSSNSDESSQQNLIDLRTSDFSLSTVRHDKKPVTLRGMSEGDLSDDWKFAIKETIDYIGGSQNMGEFLGLMYERFPKQEDISVASTIGCRLRGVGPSLL
ncbi:hypothetical protein BKA59DRAFT_455039 [Fusarium tricinctum]|uniref:Uncharacterized protein n=1 Tax=Fusarium tricinctum TaxID=61284 RepID=A0A8K0RY01_9HYPO|nr:hypothetical protein BKA59DRAFT_455039 [Fusarium tricinctum]